LADIKTKNISGPKIKTLDRAAVYTEKMKDKIVNVKNKANYNVENDSPDEYGGNVIQETAGVTAYKGTKMFNKYGKKSFETTINNFKKIKQKEIGINKIKKATKETKGLISKTEKTIKSAKATGKTAIKTAKTTGKVAKESVKGMKKAYQIAKATAKATIKTAKATAKATIAGIKMAIKASILAIKAILLAGKALIAFLVAGGWIAVVVIIVICIIAMLVGSIFGIFFSSEDTGSTITVGETQEIITMNKVISDLNIEFMNEITKIQKENNHTDYDISSNRASWKDVLAVYSVKVNGGNNSMEVATLNDEKVGILKKIFWEMNEISFTTETKTEERTIIHLTYTEKVVETKTYLHITIKSKSVDEMADKYNFNSEQRKQLAELSDEKYASMWNSVIYGTSIGSSDIVAVASSQIGNVGGQPYWSWYGFESRVEWCACFVSWCANECGYIEAGIIPKFAGCQSEGVDWFKTCNLWKDRGFIPKARRYYFL